MCVFEHWKPKVTKGKNVRTTFSFCKFHVHHVIEKTFSSSPFCKSPHCESLCLLFMVANVYVHVKQGAFLTARMNLLFCDSIVLQSQCFIA